MGFQEMMERCHNTGYRKLTAGKRPMLRKVNRRVKGFRLLMTRKLKWRSFWIAVMPSRKTMKMYSDMLNQMKIDGAYPSFIFSCQWGLPVLSHPTYSCSNPNVSFYAKP
ncbi:hypothetical protein L1987_32144 [Smallanthus sonchifolius]|uniref:Uncharacterized protein n=2 Tax=Smallanthus sonchifolius TaxID=185202 RepID=A0ACB9I7D0_9ASTR|nr:hypothetical protein L1987_32143 [Smallanthus sonchifolius]KAI3803978.1 hypothetical protein L1987_32144 [Smallanthus sonchifolius]